MTISNVLWSVLAQGQRIPKLKLKDYGAENKISDISWEKTLGAVINDLKPFVGDLNIGIPHKI